MKNTCNERFKLVLTLEDLICVWAYSMLDSNETSEGILE